MKIAHDHKIMVRKLDKQDSFQRMSNASEMPRMPQRIVGNRGQVYKGQVYNVWLFLKRKEEQAFGEFMSKRNCLEEYDRIEKIL